MSKDRLSGQEVSIAISRTTFFGPTAAWKRQTIVQDLRGRPGRARLASRCTSDETGDGSRHDRDRAPRREARVLPWGGRRPLYYGTGRARLSDVHADDRAGAATLGRVLRSLGPEKRRTIHGAKPTSRSSKFKPTIEDGGTPGSSDGLGRVVPGMGRKAGALSFLINSRGNAQDTGQLGRARAFAGLLGGSAKHVFLDRFLNEACLGCLFLHSCSRSKTKDGGRSFGRFENRGVPGALALSRFSRLR